MTTVILTENYHRINTHINSAAFICEIWTSHSTTIAFSSGTTLSSSVEAFWNNWDTLPSFHVTTMFPALRSTSSELDGEGLSASSGLPSDGPGFLSCCGTLCSSSPCLWAIAAALYFAIFFLFLNKRRQKNHASLHWAVLVLTFTHDVTTNNLCDENLFSLAS